MERLLIPVSLITFLLMGYDKFQAKADGKRIPEKVLLGLGIVGGAIGGLLGMQVFRHKIRYMNFWLVFGIAAAAQVLLVVWLKR